MTFKEKVEKIEAIKNCYCEGLGGIEKKDRKKIDFSNSRSIEGSVNLDKCLKKACPNDNRWDYAIGYKNKVYFVEIHPATAGERKKVFKKLEWLKRNKQNTVFKSDNNYYWIGTNGIKILPSSKYYKEIKKKGIMLIEFLKV